MNLVALIDGLAASGDLALIALGALAVEAILFIVFFRDQPKLFASLTCNAASGAALILGLRAALLGHGGTTIAIWLSVSLLAHAGDLWVRLRR